MITIAQKDKERINYGFGNIDTKELPYWDQLKVGVLTFRNEYQGDFFNKVLELAFSSLLKNHTLYLVFVEPYASPITRLRSYAKLFNLHRHKLADENLVEEEIIIAEGHSVMTAVLELKSANLAIVLDQLLRGSFVFGVVANQPLTKTWKIAFLQQLVQRANTNKERLRLNLPFALNELVAQDLLLFRIYADQDNREFLECWGASPAIEQLLSQLRTDLGAQLKVYPTMS